MARSRTVLHVILHTRWHREGNQTFQHARLDLVHLVDSLPTALTGAHGISFLLDGQTVLLEDYLELRPEQRQTIKTLVAAGNLHIGPWYVVPELFLASPEAIVRNLLIGSSIAHWFGARLDVGYLAETAGLIGQMPQILRGFGIESAVATRGVGEAPGELWWEAPDGSTVLLIHLRDGYDNAASLLYDAADPKAALSQARDSLREHHAADALPLMAGADNATALEQVASLNGINRRFRGTRIEVSSRPAYISDVLASGPDLPGVIGELRSPERFPILAGTLSARIWLKQRNADVQTLLERWAEPFGTWADMLHRWPGYPQNGSRLLRAPAEILYPAWRLLLKNHPHEALRGAGIDDVYREVRIRYDQAEQIAEAVAKRSLATLGSWVDTASVGNDDEIPLIVFNAHPHPHTDLASAEIDIPEGIYGFEIVDDAGAVHPCDVLELEEDDGAAPSAVHRAQVCFTASDIPGTGYRTYALRPLRELPDQAFVEDSGLTIENEFLNVSVDPADGTLTLFDKRNGRSYSGLNHFVDEGDAGDICSYSPPRRDTVIDIAAATPIEVHRYAGPALQVLEFVQVYRLPEQLTADRSGRQPFAAQYVPLSLFTTVRIARGIPRVDVEVHIANPARDHRLRVLFPTGVMAESALFDGHYEVVERALALPSRERTASWAEQPVFEQPQRAFVTVQGDESGLTIANRGLPEAAILRDRNGRAEIALTLLRSVGSFGRDDVDSRASAPDRATSAPAAQGLGQHQMHYSIIPHGPDPLPAWHQAWAFQTPLRTVTTDRHHGTLPTTDGFVTCHTPGFVLSAVKPAAQGEGLIVRGYNLYQERVPVTLSVSAPCERVRFVRMDEQPLETAPVVDDEGQIHFDAGPGEILTLLIE